tara:strand:+ start:12 stop:209 length:198 start_codon:yes stop_codon:yes gene_type:complete
MSIVQTILGHILELKIINMNNSIINIIDYVIQNYEHLNTIEMCQVLINKYDIDITDDIVDYIENN